MNGETVIPRGADVLVKLTDASESGKLAGRSELTLDLASTKVNVRMVDVNTETVSQESSSRGKRTAKNAGGTAELGAIIGAIAGGSKGAAIGAGAGAGTGLVVEGPQEALRLILARSEYDSSLESVLDEFTRYIIPQWTTPPS